METKSFQNPFLQSRNTSLHCGRYYAKLALYSVKKNTNFDVDMQCKQRNLHGCEVKTQGGKLPRSVATVQFCAVVYLERDFQLKPRPE